jgi:hypothetical protein
MTTIEQLESAKAKVLEWMAAGKFVYRSVQIGDQRVEFTTMQQAATALRTIDQLIAQNSGGIKCRTYAENNGRGFVGGCR